MHRKVADNDVLISVGANVANFNSFISLNPTASFLWDRLSHPCTANELVQALVLLDQCAENRVTPVDRLSLLQNILPHVIYPSWDRAATEKMLSLLDDLLGQVPVLRLECTPDAEAVQVLYEALKE